MDRTAQQAAGGRRCAVAGPLPDSRTRQGPPNQREGHMATTIEAAGELRMIALDQIAVDSQRPPTH